MINLHYDGVFSFEAAKISSSHLNIHSIATRHRHTETMAESNSNGAARRRRNKKKTRSGAAGSSSDTTSDDATNSGGASIERKKTAAAPAENKNPFFVITAVILMPYALYNAYLYLFLQHPELLSFIYPSIRPAVQLNDPRQLLIVGTIGSGTTQVVADLTNNLGLEIGHENAEASWSFVRDGTVSWFHGIRYIPRPGGTDDINNVKTNTSNERISFTSQVKDLCRELQPKMGFHPFMFRDGKCSLRQSWGDCWRDECEDIVKREWGCGLRSSNNQRHRDNTLLHQRRDDCETPFNKVVHQVRHPLRTIESLVAKFCIGGVEGNVQSSFLIFANALFPQHNFSEMSCIEAAGYYVDEYNSAIVKARVLKMVDDTFQVEEATPCDIAKKGGFMNKDSVYRPTRDRVLKVCNRESSNSDANQLMKSTKNRYNTGLVSLHWDDLLGGKHGSRKKVGERDLQNRIKKLTHNLGYDAK